MGSSQKRFPSDFLDSDFGTAGVVELDALLGEVNVRVNSVNSVLVLKDNLILVAVELIQGSRKGPGLLKLTHEGGLDRTFNDHQGYVDEDYVSDGYSAAYAEQLATYGDEHFLSFVSFINPKTNEYNVACTRYTLDGRRDTTFNVTGRVHLSHFPPLSTPGSLAQDGQREPNSANIEKARANSLLIGAPTRTAPLHIADGKITFNFTHKTWAFQDPHSYLVRLNSNGTLDMSFDERGFLDVQYQGTPMQIQSMPPYPTTGGWIITGKAERVGLVARLKPDGKLDESFGTAGFFATTPANGSPIQGYGITLEDAWVTAGNRIIVVGTNQQTSGRDAVAGLVFQLDEQGVSDPSFLASNWLFPAQETFFQAIAGTATGGEYWIAGLAQGNGTAFTLNASLARITAKGERDTYFNETGYLSDPSVITIKGIAVQNDGMCLVTSIDLTDEPNQSVKIRRFKA